MECELCKEQMTLFGDEHAYVRHDNHSLSKGHVIVVPRRHVADFFDMTREEKNSVIALLDRAKAANLKRAFARRLQYRRQYRQSGGPIANARSCPSHPALCRGRRRSRRRHSLRVVAQAIASPAQPKRKAPRQRADRPEFGAGLLLIERIFQRWLIRRARRKIGSARRRRRLRSNRVFDRRLRRGLRLLLRRERAARRLRLREQQHRAFIEKNRSSCRHDSGG